MDYGDTPLFLDMVDKFHRGGQSGVTSVGIWKLHRDEAIPSKTANIA